MFHTGLEAIGGARANVGLGDSTQPAAPATAMAPGARMAQQSGSVNPLMPTHPAGIALWVGVGAITLYVLLWYSLPA
jgi:hypothetical protein